MDAIVIGTAGHIDHGKSTLVRALTGIDPDRLKEEKTRGITIDLGFAHARIGGVDVAFVDVPGHERFVRNMLAGAGGIDAVMLVIAADESVMPQTREHFAICRLLDVRSGLIVLTKADLADRETLDLAALEARELVAGSALADAPVLEVSAATGQGLDALRAALGALARDVRPREDEGPPRLPIDRVFSMRGFGTVVTGTLVSGTLRADSELIVLPQERPVKVRGLQVHGASQAMAAAGRRVAVNLGGIDTSGVARGDTLTARGALEPTRRLDARIDMIADAPPLRHGARVRFHCGTTEVLGRVALAAADATGRGATELPPGAGGYARVRLEAPAVVTRGDRFILRMYSPPSTIGGGRVLDPHPPRSATRTAAGFQRFARLDATPAQAVRAMIDERGASGLPRAALTSRAGLAPHDAARVADELTAAGDVLAIGDALVARAVVDALAEALVGLVGEHHRTSPLSEGLPREEARERLFARAAHGLFDHVLTELDRSRRLRGRDRLAIPGQGVALSPEEARARETLARVYREAGLTPPDLAGAAAAGGIAPDVADRVAKLLVREKTLLKLDALLFHAERLRVLKDEVAAMKAPAGPGRVDVASFKERYGISRKYAIPLLEYLDRERVTRRAGEARVIL